MPQNKPSISSRRKIWLEWLCVGGVVLSFIALKLSTLSIRFGDGNAYLYMATQWSEGAAPYRDFFFADFPVLLYVLVGFVTVFGEWVWGYYALPVVLEACTAALLYFAARRSFGRLAILAPFLYLWSFTAFATVDYPTGLQLVSLFSVAAWICWQRKMFFVMGCLLALAALTKMYLAPGIIGLGVYLVWKRDWLALRLIILGGVSMTLVVILPILNIFASHAIDATLLHHFNRPTGIEKPLLFSFYLSREWFLLLLAAGGAYLSWRSSPLSWMLAGWVLFFMFFQDLYYLYLHVMSWALILLGLYGIAKIVAWRRENANLSILVYSSLISFTLAWLVFNQYQYHSSTYFQGQWSNYQEVARFLSKEAPAGNLYGSHEVVPLLALMTERAVHHTVIDSNAQTFGSGVHDKVKLSQSLAAENGLLITRISRYPELGITDQGFEAYFDRAVFEEHCTQLKEFEDTGRAVSNLLVIYRCSI